MFLNQAMIVVELSKIFVLFNRVYFVKTLKNDIRNFFVFKSICVHLREPARRLAGGSVAE